MKDSKEKEHRISNLRNMINHVNSDETYEEIEEDSELIDYLNEEPNNLKDLEINDEYIYRPGDEEDYAVNLEDNLIDEDFIIKTPNAKEIEESDAENEEFSDDIASEISENFDNVINAKIGGKPLLAIVSSVLGAVLIILSIFILDSRSDRVIDNVVAGETNFMFVIFFIVGILLLGYGVYKIFNVRNPFSSITNSINSIEKDDEKDDKNTTKKEEPSPKAIPKSKIPLDKDSYKIGEFDAKDMKTTLTKPATSKNKIPTQEELDNIPPAKEKSLENRGLTAEEIEKREYERAKLESESIDDIFAEAEEIDEIPIISIDSEEKQ